MSFFVKRKNFKLLIAGGVIFLFYIYIFIYSSRIDLFLNRSNVVQKDRPDKNKVKSPFEGPVDDILQGQFEFKIVKEEEGETERVGAQQQEHGFRKHGGFRKARVIRARKKTTTEEPREEIVQVLGEIPGVHQAPRLPELPAHINTSEAMRDSVGQGVKGRIKECCTEVKTDKKLYMEVRLPPFKTQGKPGDPGENGRSYHWRPNELTNDELAQKEKDFRLHYFDEWLSRKISVHRSLPDDRRPECKITYSYLPSASVVIVFHNEAWSTLLRSIHSILDRTPKKLLHEILLLDDFSSMDHLKDPLEAYIKPLSKVKLFRSSKRLGLIKARNYAFEYSKGKIVIFLDSHIECYPGWIEPLIAPILNDSRVITFPTIEFISGSTFGTTMNSKLERTVGGLMLNSLSFNWLYERKHSGTYHPLYYPSPTMPGGLYAVSREWFSKLGKNDPEMEFWGGENIEMSFKTWMCGGSLQLSLCSHVGHIFRNTNPNLKGVHMTYKNPVRVAEVWMDRYKHYFYEKLAYNIPDYGNITSRVQIRKSLQCQNFRWYLLNVFPELMKKMDTLGVYYGEIKNVDGTACLTRQDNRVNIDACRLGAVTQQWQFGTDQRIVSGEFILAARMEVKSGKEKLELMLIHDRGIDHTVYTTWKYEKQRIIHLKTGMCLESSLYNRNVDLKLCLASSDHQKWNMTTREQNKKMMKTRGVNIDWTV